ncbi:hypothetical protein [Thalassotalea sp. PS06]|uniref:hypothetical protein n=1 Tax=Thalassotalea sp. PS06 TaxID=2594005 RepID=UPI0011643F18|nr:hypothetical protein [Thalassotalea sp. PS06]QDP02524.1 hypothetical protein FNC98_14885 [Thalassotalea sp. PS06]
MYCGYLLRTIGRLSFSVFRKYTWFTNSDFRYSAIYLTFALAFIATKAQAINGVYPVDLNTNFSLSGSHTADGMFRPLILSDAVIMPTLVNGFLQPVAVNRKSDKAIYFMSELFVAGTDRLEGIKRWNESNALITVSRGTNKLHFISDGTASGTRRWLQPEALEFILDPRSIFSFSEDSIYFVKHDAVYKFDLALNELKTIDQESMTSIYSSSKYWIGLKDGIVKIIDKTDDSVEQYSVSSVDYTDYVHGGNAPRDEFLFIANIDDEDTLVSISDQQGFEKLLPLSESELCGHSDSEISLGSIVSTNEYIYFKSSHDDGSCISRFSKSDKSIDSVSDVQMSVSRHFTIQGAGESGVLLKVNQDPDDYFAEYNIYLIDFDEKKYTPLLDGFTFKRQVNIIAKNEDYLYALDSWGCKDDDYCSKNRLYRIDINEFQKEFIGYRLSHDFVGRGVKSAESSYSAGAFISNGRLYLRNYQSIPGLHVVSPQDKAFTPIFEEALYTGTDKAEIEEIIYIDGHWFVQERRIFDDVFYAIRDSGEVNQIDVENQRNQSIKRFDDSIYIVPDSSYWDINESLKKIDLHNYTQVPVWTRTSENEKFVTVRNDVVYYSIDGVLHSVSFEGHDKVNHGTQVPQLNLYTCSNEAFFSSPEGLIFIDNITETIKFNDALFNYEYSEQGYLIVSQQHEVILFDCNSKTKIVFREIEDKASTMSLQHGKYYFDTVAKKIYFNESTGFDRQLVEFDIETLNANHISFNMTQYFDQIAFGEFGIYEYTNKGIVKKLEHSRTDILKLEDESERFNISFLKESFGNRYLLGFYSHCRKDQVCEVKNELFYIDSLTDEFHKIPEIGGNNSRVLKHSKAGWVVLSEQNTPKSSDMVLIDVACLIEGVCEQEMIDQPGVFGPAMSYHFQIADSVNLPIVFSDVDSELVQFSLDGAPEWLRIENSNVLKIAGSVPDNIKNQSIFTFHINSFDGSNSVQSEEIEFNIESRNTTPYASDAYLEDVDVTIQGSFDLKRHVKDFEWNELTFRLLDAPEGFSILDEHFLYIDTPNAGDYTITVEFSDGVSPAATILVHISVIDSAKVNEEYQEKHAGGGGTFSFYLLMFLALAMSMKFFRESKSRYI